LKRLTLLDLLVLDLKTREDLQKLVDEGLEESLTLDYKASPALSRESKEVFELCKDVSALANSAGGRLIYGIEEDKRTKRPSRVDNGVADEKITREWLEQVLNSRIQPRLQGVRINRIPMGNGAFGYVIDVPPSSTGHQAPDLKYYRRFELQSVPMYDYEIRDVMRRSTTPELYLNITLSRGDNASVEFGGSDVFSKPVPLSITIGNRSAQPAHYSIVQIGFSEHIAIYEHGDFEKLGLREEEDLKKVWFLRRLSTPPNLPVFQESETDLTGGKFQLAFNYKLMSGDVIHKLPISTSIKTPGFSASVRWTLTLQGQYLELKRGE
jgi:Putative DNA-binding domain